MYAEILLKKPLNPTKIIQTVYLSISGRSKYMYLSERATNERSTCYMKIGTAYRRARRSLQCCKELHSIGIELL